MAADTNAAASTPPGTNYYERLAHSQLLTETRKPRASLGEVSYAPRLGGNQESEPPEPPPADENRWTYPTPPVVRSPRGRSQQRP